MSKNMTVKGKLTLAFSCLAVMISMVSLLAMKSLGDANDRFSGYVQGINARLLLSYELRTAIERRAIGARDLVNASSEQDKASAKQEVEQAHADAEKRLAKLLEMAAAPDVPQEARQLIANIADVEKKYAPVALAIVDLALKGQREAAVAKMNSDCRPLLSALIKASEAYRDFAASVSTDRLAQATDAYKTQRNLLIAGCLIALASAIIAGAMISRSLLRALGAEPAQLGAVAQRVAGGDLSPIDDGSRAIAHGSVLASLNHMQQSLASMVGKVRETSDSIATGSAEIATGNTDLSQRTEEQASNLQQTAASMEQLSSTVKNSAETAREANAVATQAAEAARQGSERVNQVVNAMDEIAQSSRKISEIIGVIDGIAFQTNILALNAAVEAARAGEQGRGFAVVASEVRTLAQRSAEAAKEIKTLIGSSVDRVEVGSRQVDEAGASMGEILTQVQRVSHMINELSNASSEQSQGINQVGDAVQQLDQVTQQNAALVEETAAAAESLRNQAHQLALTMGQFKIAGSGASTYVAPNKPIAVPGGRPAQAPASKPPAKQPTRKAAVLPPAAVIAQTTPAQISPDSDDWSSF